MSLHHFLLVYNRHDQHLEYEEFDDAAAAGVAYERLEKKYRDRREIEVVLIGADSIETVKRTHSNYFSRNELPFVPA
jgi:vacuolar-type H+-ATPase subunit F/Vma7